MIDIHRLRSDIERLYAEGASGARDDAREAFGRLRDALTSGLVRAAEPDAASPTGWRVNAWVKQGILVGFRHGTIVESAAGSLAFSDKDTLPLRAIDRASAVRVVPGGSSIRAGVYIGQRVVCMPPMYINIGAWVDDDSMIDSHALVGSCAQVGRRVHVSAAAQIGGVLEPIGALPVIVEDDVLVGGNCGIYEGAIVKRRAVLASGTIITGSTPIFDLVHATIIRRDGEAPIVVPEGAVVVPGSRAVTQEPGRSWGLSLSTPVIVKYRDERTDARVELEQWIR
jgi:2,3,4,5-tetrahydropyridine-2-carboxylate N-succinyltransferase